MGVRNATRRLFLSSTSPGTIMTGNAIQLSIDIMDFFIVWKEDKFVKSVCSVLGFLCGATIGGIGYIAFGFAAILIPVAIVLVIVGMELWICLLITDFSAYDGGNATIFMLLQPVSFL